MNELVEKLDVKVLGGETPQKVRQHLEDGPQGRLLPKR
jgi:hypothetical protein